METLRLAAGIVAVRDDRLVVVCEIARTGTITVRDLVSGQTISANASELSAPRNAALDRKAFQSDAALTKSSALRWQRAVKREACVVAVLTRQGPFLEVVREVARNYQVSERSVRRWVAQYRQIPSVAALLDPTWGVHPDARRLDVAVETVIRQTIDALYLSRPHATYVVVHEEVHRRCEREGLATPSLNAVIRRVKALDPWIVAKHQLGREEANRRVGPKPGSLSATAPLSIVQIDHTLVDVHVVDDVHRKSIGRPWITLAIDVATRCVLGMHLSLEAPSVASVATCISHAGRPKERWLAANRIEAQWPIWGLPLQLHADNAREFKSEALSKGCAQWAIEMAWCPLGKPHYGGHIERLIGTLMGRVHLLPGTTQSNPQKKGRYPSEKAAQLTLSELQRWLTLEICERYHLNVHRALGGAPIHAWQDWFASRGEALAIVGDDERFKLSFLPIIYRKMQREGLYLMQIRYWNNVLPTIAKLHERILLRYDPADLSTLYALDRSGTYWPIHYADLRQPSITLAEAKVALAARGAHELRRRQSFRLFERALKQREVVAKAAKSSKVARRTQQRRTQARLQSNAGNQKTTVTAVDYSKPVIDFPVEIWEERE